MYGSSYSFRSQRGPRNYIRRTKRSFRGVSGRIARIAKRTVYNMAEVKYATYSKNENLTTLDKSVMYDMTPNIPLGTDKNSRIGNKIKYKMLTFNASLWGVLPEASTTNLPQFLHVRVVLFQYRNNITTSAQLLDSDGSYLDLVATLKPNNVRVLNDERFTVSVLRPNTTVGYNGHGISPDAVNFSWHHKVSNNVNFNSSSNRPTDVEDLYGVHITVMDPFYAGAATVALKHVLYTRLSFLDV